MNLLPGYSEGRKGTCKKYRYSSIEYIIVDDSFEYAPLIYQFPPFCFDQVLISGKDVGGIIDNSTKRKRCDDGELNDE